MILKGTFLRVVDNSGARLAQVIGKYGQYSDFSRVGNVVNVAVKEAKGEKVTSGQVTKAVIVETKYPVHRKNGAHYQYLRNACILINDKGAPLGNRIRAMLGYDFNKPRWKRVSSLGKRLF